MGDRCHMTVQCRVKDILPFIELGFHLDEREGNLATLIEEEANYGHGGDMPKDVAYFCACGDGGNYDAQDEYQNTAGESNYRCRTTSTGLYAFSVDDEGNLDPKDKADWLKFIRLRNEVAAYLKVAMEEEETEVMPEDAE
jgi:hypothetical protein